MKRGILLSLSASLALASLFLSACSKEQPMDSNTDSGTTEELSLEKDFGGYTTSDEAPMFNDQDVMAEAVEDVAASDQVSAETLALAESNANVRAYFVRLKWGLLAFDSSATEVVNWSGSIEITRGTLGVLKKIAFEPGDYIQRPRDSRKQISFVSVTKPHMDGLLLAIVDQDTLPVDGSLTINLDGYTRTISYGELDSLDLIEAIDASGHEISIVSRVKDVRPFAGGFLEGRWARDSRLGGVFHGRWISRDGENTGALRGIWGVRRNGEKVFFGKYIDNDGRFGGLLRGHWDHVREDRSGWFEGRWHDRNLDVHGTLKGHFIVGNDQGQRGFFAGTWVKL